jgi:hypothetical protein
VGVILNAENYEHLVLDPEMKQGRRDHASTSETSHVFPKADLKEVNWQTSSGSADFFEALDQAKENWLLVRVHARIPELDLRSDVDVEDRSYVCSEHGLHLPEHCGVGVRADVPGLWFAVHRVCDKKAFHQTRHVTSQPQGRHVCHSNPIPVGHTWSFRFEEYEK